MASGSLHCKDCGLNFDTSQSLDVHLQYHKENLISMWMASEEVKRESTEGSGDLAQQMSSGASSTMNPSVTSANGNLFVKQESTKDPHEIENQPAFIGPPPISPMDYDFKVEPCIQSPQSNLISQGPSSGSGTVNYSQSSPSGFYTDFNHQSMQQHQNPFGGFSSSYTNGAFDDQFYNRGNPAASRYHPYLGRSPVPTPSPGATADIKEERLTPSTPEILDLDSQKVLNSSTTTQQNQMGPLPTMWRPHETFPSFSNVSSNTCLTPTGMGPSPTGMRTTGLGPSPSGLGPSPTGLGPSPSGLGPSPTGLGPSPSGLGPSPSTLGPSSGNLGPSTPSVGLGPSSGLGLSSGLGPAQMAMLPPMQQSSYGNQHSLNPSHQIISPNSNDSLGFASNNTMSSYYSTGISASSGMPKTSSVQFASNPAQSPSSREGPPTEYPSNVKRVKSFKCEDCNKWFTSHGHLKRHYNTTLHKNMTKLNNSNNSSTATHTPSAADLTRPPILSPSSKSIGESSTTSSHDEESNLSNTDSLEPTPNAFQPTGSAFQPPVSIPSYSSHNALYAAPSTVPIVPINPGLPHYSQAHTFHQPEQPLTAPTMYHGHFSTNPTPYVPQPPVTGSGPFFLGNNYIYQQQGGLHGPGFHSMNEYPGPSQVDGFNSFRLDNNDRTSHHLVPGGDSVPRTSPEPAGESGSEASMDSSESNSTTGASDNYKCNDCNKTFNRMCYLTQHRSTYHEGEKPYKCGTCGKRFTDEVTFNDHQGKHAGEKPYKCEVCPKQFNHKTDLRRHMCLHTGEKPFSCEQCGKGFIRKDHMLKHFQTHRKKALAAAANAASHPSMPPNPPGFPAHPGLPPPHGSLPHPTHGPRGHPHVVAPTVY